MGDVIRFNWTVFRALCGLHRTPLLREQVKRLKLDPLAPFPSQRNLAPVIRLSAPDCLVVPDQ